MVEQTDKFQETMNVSKILVALSDHGAMTNKEISDITHFKEQYVSRLLKEMEEDYGYVTIEKGEGFDKRKNKVKIKFPLGTARALHWDIGRHLFLGNDEEAEMIMNGLQKIKRMLKRK